MKHVIEVNGIKLYAYHGCLPEEKKIGGHYVVDVKIETDFYNAFKSDDIKDTVDYVVINKLVKKEMSLRSKLIEHVGYRIMESIKASFDNINKINIKVTKCSPPIGGEVNDVSIVIEEVV